MMQQLPVPVIYIRVPPVCCLSNFYTVALEALSHPITTGKLKDKRPRARGRLKAFETRLLIIDDAEYLTYEALCELAQIYDMLKIPTVLIGTYCLEKVLKTRYWDRMGNSFLDGYEYLPMTQKEMLEVIKLWEIEFLKWPEEHDFRDPVVFKEIQSATEGLRDALNEVLRKAAIKALNQGTYKITAEIIRSVLHRRVKPQVKPAVKKPAVKAS